MHNSSVTLYTQKGEGWDNKNTPKFASKSAYNLRTKRNKGVMILYIIYEISLRLFHSDESKRPSPKLQIPYTILGGTYIALYSWRLFYYVEILYLQDGVLIGEAKW